jgi:N-acetyl-1-D-myo-inositol-2-amino-2-deoxy-alpha-D-glucopyranoside deacetylase
VNGDLLVVTAHPDDEVLIAGGTLAATANAGFQTGVLCLTRGELGPIASDSGATRAELGAVRAAELRAACAELGVDWVGCGHYPDGNLTWSEPDEIVAQIAEQLDRRRPSAVITFGEDGLYWHPDHIATFDYTRRALADYGHSIELYRSIWPPTLMPDLVSELSERGLPTGLWDLAPEDFGIELEPDVSVDARPFVERKLRALRQHRTQLDPGHAFRALPLDLAERFLGVEHFAAVRVG